MAERADFDRGRETSTVLGTQGAEKPLEVRRNRRDGRRPARLASSARRWSAISDRTRSVRVFPRFSRRSVRSMSRLQHSITGSVPPSEADAVGRFPVMIGT